MATHFMRILSRMMVPGPARTPSRPDVRAAAAVTAAAVRGQLQPHWVHQSPLPTHKIAILRCSGNTSQVVISLPFAADIARFSPPGT